MFTQSLSDKKMKISFEEAKQIAKELVKSRSRNKMVILDEQENYMK